MVSSLRKKIWPSEGDLRQQLPLIGGSAVLPTVLSRDPVGRAEKLQIAESTIDVGVALLSLCATTLPDRDLGSAGWAKQYGSVFFQITPIPDLGETGDDAQVHGVPFGRDGRLCLMALQTAAVRSQSRFLEFSSLSGFMSDILQRSPGGSQYGKLNLQLKRLAYCTMTLQHREGDGETVKTALRKVQIIERYEQEKGAASGQATRLRIELSEPFYEALHAEPLLFHNAHLAHLKSPLALDIYVWLMSRRVDEELVPGGRFSTAELYEALRGGEKLTTGASGETRREAIEPSKDIKSFRRALRVALDQLAEIYPCLKFEVVPEGVAFFPSRMPIGENSLVHFLPHREDRARLFGRPALVDDRQGVLALTPGDPHQGRQIDALA